MKNIVLGVLILAGFFFPQKKDLNGCITNLIKEAGIPGLSIAVINNDSISDLECFGFISNDTKIPVNNETIFAAASLSKPLFAYAVFKLVDEGKFNIDKPLYEYLEYKDIEKDERYKKITARMVLTHSSGFPNWRNNELEILFDPGEKFQYSGEGFVYLQKVIEKITGKSLEEFAREKVFLPLGMENTSYTWQNRFENNFAVPHDESGITQIKYKPEEPNAAHSLQTTAEDYAKFILALLNHTGIKEKTLDEMLTPQINVSLSGESNSQTDNLVSWGLGVGLQETSKGYEFWHWGDNGTFKCFFTASKERGKGVVYFTNSSAGLSITPKLVELIMGTEQPGWEWNNYTPYDSHVNKLFKSIVDEGYDKAIIPYLDMTKRHADSALIKEREMNRLGYRLLSVKRIYDAKKVFYSNLTAFPNTSNVYDSYAEACLLNGEPAVAAEYYSKAYKMNPENNRAGKIAEKLTGPQNGNVMFKLESYSNAKLVALAGDFNGWNSFDTFFRREDGSWVCRIDLKPGRYKYKFVVDGVWIIDDGNPKTDYDGKYYNSVIEVR